MKLDRVLYIRVSQDLIALLDAMLAAKRAAHPGQVISRADLVRELLYAGVKK